MSDALLGCQRTGEPLPFEHLFIAVVLEARAVLQNRVTASCFALLRAEAHASWERYLLKRLCNAGAKAAHCQFQAFRTARSVFSRAEAKKRLEPSVLYQEFVGASAKERLQKLFKEFPKLSEYCDLLVSDWVATVSEFLDRLEADRRHFDANFVGESFACPVVSLQAGLSDPHHGGRCVVRLHFENGSNLLYKPRSIASEARFFDLLGEFNAQTIPHQFRPPQCWERDGYGWMENVSPCPCKTFAEVQAFYWRAGALLALVYLARGVDMHRENLIAAGEFPVLIDLETLWHPQEQTDGVRSPILDSVLNTGFLPVTNPQTGVVYEWNALGHRLDINYSTTLWTSVNEDKMALEPADRPSRHSQHLPVLAGAKYLAGDFLDNLLAGFCWIGTQILEDSQKRERFQRWLKIVMQCTRRKILRPSLWYQLALERLTTPSLLRKKEIAAFDLAHLMQNSISITQPEWQSLQRLEIPWLKQTVGQETDSINMLPAQTMDEFLAQQSLIADAFATHSKGDYR